jgi:hypothetical protein
MPTLLKLGFESVKAAVGSKVIEKKSAPTEPESGDKLGANGTHKHETIPCPGITEANDPRVPTYLHRTGIFGGGA